ncbi:MAG TPA: hypothetical protein PKD28_02155 [Candidatus Saccharibacteria bacterium]|nr:hypothetical protein [Candidatus Saccharibacteria bacterium]
MISHRQEILRNEAEQTMRQLIAGLLAPAEASLWAHTTYFDGDNQVIIESSPSLSDLFNSLSMADLPQDTKDSLLYNNKSYVEWYHEYKESLEEESKSYENPLD